MRVAEKDLLISAGQEGTIVGLTLSESDFWNSRQKAHEQFKIEIGDRIRSIASLRNGNTVAATEEGFLLFQLSPEMLPATAQTT